MGGLANPNRGSREYLVRYQSEDSRAHYTVINSPPLLTMPIVKFRMVIII